MTPDARELEGLWQMIRAEFDGDPAPELVITKTTLELSADGYAIRFDGEIADAGNFTAGEANGHLTLTLTGVTGTNHGRTIPAIYQHAGDRLRICFGFAGKPPTRFATAAESQLYLATYRRIAG
jgi:uncharacterized protein (TIGR03067 family)